MKRIGALTTVLLACACAPAIAQAAPHLERVVIVLRHGVRPPTKPADQIAGLADKPWPGDDVWGVKPAELTAHGAAEIRKLGKDLRKTYADERPGGAIIWADGADQRTRETARNLALGLSPGAPLAFGAVADGTHDPLFSGPGADVCPLDPAAMQAAAKGMGPVMTRQTVDALKDLQRIAAPNGCTGGGGPCLTGETTLTATTKSLKISGPLSTGAAISENLLLEYENSLPMDQVGWGRVSRADLDVVMAAHRRVSDIERAAPMVASRRGGPMARFILDALRNDAVAEAIGPKVKASDKMVVLAGHDTNLANMGGVFGLDWSLPGQPDVTAPGTAMAFERWRGDDGKMFVKVRIFYTTPDQVRTLSDTPPHEISVTPAACAGAKACGLETLEQAARARMAQACPQDAATTTTSSRP
ncbi:MAG TPA: histidine-type phosphatase [Caulobacteraceae bacterium]|jgi:4-phytase/acid phosphatase|nr:histidine-type phosphatase [Caulobacteraceae bacterium]